MHTNVILTNKRCTHTHNLSTPIQNLKPGLGTSYAIQPGNGVDLFYTPERKRERDRQTDIRQIPEQIGMM